MPEFSKYYIILALYLQKSHENPVVNQPLIRSLLPNRLSSTQEYASLMMSRSIGFAEARLKITHMFGKPHSLGRGDKQEL